MPPIDNRHVDTSVWRETCKRLTGCLALSNCNTSIVCAATILQNLLGRRGYIEMCVTPSFERAVDVARTSQFACAGSVWRGALKAPEGAREYLQPKPQPPQESSNTHAPSLMARTHHPLGFFYRWNRLFSSVAATSPRLQRRSALVEDFGRRGERGGRHVSTFGLDTSSMLAERPRICVC